MLYDPGMGLQQNQILEDIEIVNTILNRYRIKNLPLAPLGFGKEIEHWTKAILCPR